MMDKHRCNTPPAPKSRASGMQEPYGGQDTPASAEEIRAIAGQLDDVVVAALLQTGATREEIMLAWVQLEENYYTMAVLERPMAERVRSAYDILDYASNGFIGRRRGH